MKYAASRMTVRRSSSISLVLPMPTVFVTVHPGKHGARREAVQLVTNPFCNLSTRVVVSRAVFRFTWCAVLVLHTFCGSFGAALAALHAFIATPDMFAYLVGVLQIPLEFLRGGAAIFGLLSIGHFAVALRMVFVSIRQRQLSFVPLDNHLEIIHYEGSGRPPLAHRVFIRRFLELCMFPVKSIFRLWQRMFGVDGAFGVNGKHFDSWFIARETVELLSQLYQTYQLSTAVASSWVNRFAVTTVVLNSLSTSIVRLNCAYIKTRSSTRRLVTVIADLVLDFCGSIVVPVCILYRIVSEFDWERKSVPPELVYSDVWVADSVAEARQLLITSTLDLVSSLALHLGVLGALLTTAVDVRCEETVKVDNERRVLAGRRPYRARKTVVDFSAKTRYIRRIHSATEWCFAVIGVFVIVAHIQSQRDPSDMPACLLHVDSWFTPKFPCSVLRYSCPQNQDIDSLLRRLDPSVLTALIVSHCSDSLRIPIRLNSFVNIRQLKFVNMSSLTWDEGLEIDQTHHPQLGYILFGYTNMTTVPSVLLHDRLPLSLREIEWSHSNLSALPSDIDRFWTRHEWVAISFDHTMLQEIPTRFFNIRVQTLWLVDNKLDQIQPEAFESASLQKIVLSGNPMLQLPQSVREVSPSLREVYVEFTQLQSVPPWIDTWKSQTVKSIVSFYGSDVCLSKNSSDTLAQPSRVAESCGINFRTIQGTIDWDFVWTYQKITALNKQTGAQ